MKLKKNSIYPKNPTQLGWFVSKITKPFYNKQGFAQNHIIENWETIAGVGFSKNSIPIKLSIQKTGGVLTVACDGGVALELEYSKSEIIEKVNSYYGFIAINRIKFQNLPIEIKDNNMKKESKPRSGDKNSPLKEFFFFDNLESKTPLEKALFKLENSVLKKKNEL